MIATSALLAVLAMATASPELAPVSPAVDAATQQAVASYYERELHRGANPRIHAIKVVGERQVRDGTATLTCVSLTYRLRMFGDQTFTEALMMRGSDVVRRDTGNAALQACSVV